MKNAPVARILYDVGGLLELRDVPFKPRAYRRAARAVEDCPTAIEDLLAEGRVQELPGVGEAIAGKVAEIATTGRLRLHEELKAEPR